MQKMIATSNIEYPPGSCFEPGDEFDVADEHVRLLVTLGRAELPEPSEREPAPREMFVAPHLNRRTRRAA